MYTCSRIAPETRTTIPRLELKGAVVLAELIEKLNSALSTIHPLLPCMAWCDSQVVLHWIKGDQQRWKPYIRNRTTLIRDVVSPDSWRYVKSAENPADQLSRGDQLPDWDTNLWFNGPQWLRTWSDEENFEKRSRKFSKSCKNNSFRRNRNG